MRFKTIAVVTALVTFVLGVVYLFAGELALARWQIEPSDSVLLLGRRIGALYLGLSVIFFLARSAPRSTVRTALSAGATVTLWLLVFLGACELAAGHVGPGILGSVVVESILALAYTWLLLAERKIGVEREEKEEVNQA